MRQTVQNRGNGGSRVSPEPIGHIPGSHFTRIVPEHVHYPALEITEAKGPTSAFVTT